MSPEISQVEERDAVYYPFIHVRDREWLNGTLLYFPHLFRMVPSHYPLNDDRWVRKYAETAGRRNKPLLQTMDFWQGEVSAAHERLAAKIQEDIERSAGQFLKRFSRVAAAKLGRKEFRISEDRLVGLGASHVLYRLLKDNHLVWYSSEGEFGIHPVLGEAIMATVAMAVAERDGMDVVTPSTHIHDVLAARRSDAIYDALVRESAVPPPPKPELVSELASIVLLGAFDVAKLSAADIARLHQGGEDLTAFRSELVRHLGTVPDIHNRDLREEHLREQAMLVLEEWRRHRLNLSAFARGILTKDAFDLGTDAAKDLVSGLLLGTTAVISTASGAGMIVAVVTYAAKRTVDLVGQAKRSPYRWLNRVHKAGATAVPAHLWESRLVLPSESVELHNP